MSNKIYLIANQQTVWGAGKTRQDAVADAAQWLCDSESGRQGITVDQVEVMLISEYESRNGGNGVYIIEYEGDWPENTKSMDGDAWLRHYWKSTED